METNFTMFILSSCLSFNTVWTVSKRSGRLLYCPDGFNTVRLQYCPDGFNNVRTDSTLSRQFQYRPDSFNTVQTFSILSERYLELSGKFQYCPNGLNAVWIISILSILLKLSGKFYYPLLYLARGDLHTFSYVATDDLSTFYMS